MVPIFKILVLDLRSVIQGAPKRSCPVCVGAVEYREFDDLFLHGGIDQAFNLEF